MQIATINGRYSVAGLARPARAVVRQGASAFLYRARQEEALDLLTRLEDTLERLAGARPTIGVRQSRSQPSVTSDAQLGLVTTATAARMVSTAQVNVFTTSHSPTTGEWDGASTAQVSITGTYDGSQGADNLTVEVTRANGSGAGNRELEVRDSLGAVIDTVFISRTELPGVAHGLSNGLILSVGAGPTFRNDSFAVNVDVDTTQDADPDGAFDGTGGTDANLDTGVHVNAGTFTVNGAQVDVQADDSINTVLARITANTDVMATYDAAQDSVILTQGTAGASPTITLGPDTSGFLDAVKLTSAAVSPGLDRQHDQARLDEVGAFAGVQTGAVGVNDESIAFDVRTDSLAEVLSRIESAAPGVSAGYVLSRDRVLVQGSLPSLRIDDRGTSFFAALRISPEEYFGRLEEGGVGHAGRRAINNALHDLVGDLRDLERLRRQSPDVLGGFATSLSALLDEHEDDGLLRQLGFGRGDGIGLEFQSAGARRLERLLKRDAVATLEALFGDGASDAGLVDRLRVTTTAALSIRSRGL